MKGEKMRETDRKVRETDERRQAAWQEGQGLQQGAAGRRLVLLPSESVNRDTGWGGAGGGDGAARRGRWRGRCEACLRYSP